MDGWRLGAAGAAMRVLLAALVLACLLPLHAQAAAPGISNIRFRSFSVTQGLPQASVITIAQDRQGFLWFGTQDGLARFDGYEFRVYRHQQGKPDSLSNNFAKNLVAAPDGGLWIGTQIGGIDYIDPRTGKFTHYRADHGKPGTLASDTILALAIGAHDRLWIASLGARLQWIDPGSRAVHDAPVGEQAVLGNVRVILPLANGDLLLGTSLGLWRVDADGTHLRPWGDIGKAAPLDVFALAVGGDGDVWAGTSSDGLYRFKADGSLIKHLLHSDSDPDSLPDDQVRALQFDPDGRLWIGGNTRGLALLVPGTGEFRNFMHDPADPQSVAGNRIWSLAIDHDGLLLVGSWASGFSIHDPRTEMFTQISSIPGDPRTLATPEADAVYGDKDGTLWVGMLENGGLAHVDLKSGVIAHYAHDPADPASLAGDSVMYVSRTRDGTLWVSVLGAGLDSMRPDGKGFVHMSHDPDDPGSLGSNVIRYVYLDGNGTLWVATKDAGLDERCATCTAFIHHRPGGQAGSVDDIGDIDTGHVLETRDGAIWVASRSSGLYRRAKGEKRFHNIRDDGRSGLSSDSITTLYQDPRGDLWVGTQGGGLDVLRKADLSNRFEVVNEISGLASDAIGEVLEDQRGYIWVSTLKGISRVNPATLEVQNFSAHSGASELGYWINAGTHLADGQLAFGGLRGVTVLAPQALTPPPPARPAITAIILRGQRYGSSANLPKGASWKDGMVSLHHQQDEFGAEFTSLEYSSPLMTRYEYRLAGYDPYWIETPANRRVAYYTNLPPGTYRLQVRARHDGGAWSKDTADLSFDVLPPPWASAGAYTAYAAALLLLAGITGWRIRANVRRKRRANAVLLQSRERLKLALWGSGNEMWDADLRDGSLQHENRLPNIAAGKEAAAQTLSAYRAFLHPEDAASFDAAMREHLTGRSGSFEASYRTLDLNHEWVWVLTRGRVVERDDNGRAVRMIGTNADITELKRAEDSLRRLNDSLEQRVEQRTHELHSANAELRALLDQLTRAQDQLVESEKLASLGSLVAGVAHEINTPLGVGVTAASYLHDETERLARAVATEGVQPELLRQFSARINEGAGLILNNLRRADRLVKSFKQVAVDQTGGDVREFNVGQCIDGVVTALRPSLRHGKHTITLTGPDDLVVRSSPGALGQVVTNLVINSITHGFDEGQPGQISIELSRLDTGVRLDYRDNGKGMPPNVRAHVYEPFFTTRRGQGGSGLGMHIVYTLVTQLLHGSIELETRPGEGVHFRIGFGSIEDA